MTKTYVVITVVGIAFVALFAGIFVLAANDVSDKNTPTTATDEPTITGTLSYVDSGVGRPEQVMTFRITDVDGNPLSCVSISFGGGLSCLPSTAK